jgi:hypothetical protein
VGNSAMSPLHALHLCDFLTRNRRVQIGGQEGESRPTEEGRAWRLYVSLPMPGQLVQMSETEQFLLGLLLGSIVVVATSGALLLYFTIRRPRIDYAQEIERRQLYSEQARRRLRPIIERYAGTASVGDMTLIDFELQPILLTGARFSKEAVPREVDRMVKAVEDRLARVERRFPEESTIDKIASVNDAILATKVEQLEKAVKEIEPRLLARWDVAIVTLAIVSAITGLAGLIFTVANFMLK